MPQLRMGVSPNMVTLNFFRMLAGYIGVYIHVNKHMHNIYQSGSRIIESNAEPDIKNTRVLVLVRLFRFFHQLLVQ